MAEYNPRNSSFIKVPETKCCITCGQPLPSDVKPMTNFMNRYINDINGTEVVLNSNDDYIEIQGVKLRKKGVELVKVPAIKGVVPAAPAPAVKPVTT